MNVPTLIVFFIIAAVTVSILIKAVKDKKNGRCSCSCGCESCVISGNCKGKTK